MIISSYAIHFKKLKNNLIFNICKTKYITNQIVQNYHLWNAEKKREKIDPTKTWNNNICKTVKSQKKLKVFWKSG